MTLRVHRTRSKRELNSTTFTAGALLVVDDNDDDLHLTTGILRKAGGVQEILEFRGGEEIVEYLSAMSTPRPPGLILDVKMPKLNGLDVLGWLRGERRFDRVPVAMWSSSDDPRDVARALQLGAQFYFGKYPAVDSVRGMIEAMRLFQNGERRDAAFAVKGNLLAAVPAAR